MKNTVYIMVAIFLLIACKQNEINPLDTTNIMGTWQLVEQYDGGSIKPLQSVKDGYLYEFNSDLTFTSDKKIGCPNNATIEGSFSVQNISNQNILLLKYNCNLDDFEGAPEYIYTFDNNKMLLEPRTATCDEGCYKVFKKIADEEVKVSE